VQRVTAWLTLVPNRRSWVQAAISSASACWVADGADGTVPRAAAGATAPT